MSIEGVSIHQLRALVAIAETLSFTLAGERLGLSQPAISALIKRLEKEVGQPLLVRSRNLQLTAAGRLLSENAVRNLRSIDESIAECQSQSTLKRGRVKVAVGHLSAAFLLPAVLRQFQAKHPELDVQIIDCTVDVIKSKLVQHDADLGIGAEGRLADSELLIEGLLKSRLALFVSNDHPIAGLSSVSAEILGELPLIQLNSSAQIWRHINRQLISANIYPTVEHHVTMYSTAMGMVQAGIGVAILPAMASAQLPGSVRMVPLHSPEIYWPISAVRLAKHPLPPSAQAFMTVLRSSMRAFEAHGTKSHHATTSL